VLALIAGLVVVVGVSFAFFRVPALGSISGEALNYSVTNKVGGNLALGVGPCHERRGGGWGCTVPDAERSGAVGFRVNLRGRCWRAERVSPQGEGPPLASGASGCVSLCEQAKPQVLGCTPG